MKRKKKKNELEIYSEIYMNLWEQTKLEKEYLESQIEKQRELLSIHMENEPFKIFRKSYMEWGMKKEDLEIELKKFVLELEEVTKNLKQYEKDFDKK